MPEPHEAASANTADGPVDTAVQRRPRPAHSKPKSRQLPPYKVILHNDEVNTMEDVVRAILMITPLNPAHAIQRMREAHVSGTAVLLVTHKERGELYVGQFASLKITTTLEADG